MTTCPFETFPSLARLPVVHAFTGRVASLDVKTDRNTALDRLDAYHLDVRTSLGLGQRHYRTAQQVHGAGVAVVDARSVGCTPDVDALVTADPSVCLGIYVADCGPVFLVDPVRNVIGGAHSGRKGTELGIVGATIATMTREFGSNPSDLVIQLGPCIRPPLYEIDFATEIVRQAEAAGVQSVHDCRTCTGANIDRYYSYRIEKGQTGRMVAYLALSL
jgi:polyphenol oxidase